VQSVAPECSLVQVSHSAHAILSVQRLRAHGRATTIAPKNGTHARSATAEYD
jgi:hypothetical protein